MKLRMLGLGLGVFAVAAVAGAQIQTLNTVGFQKVTLERGKLYLVSNAFEDYDGNDLTSSDVFGSQLPNGSQVFHYDGVTPYQVDTKTVAGWSANITYTPSIGVWVKVPETAAEATYDVVFKGQVAQVESVDQAIAHGLNMLGYPYCADVTFQNTSLAANAGNGDRLLIFDSATQSYGSSVYTKTVAGWSQAAKSTVIPMGSGFWFYSAKAGAVVNTEPSPY